MTMTHKTLRILVTHEEDMLVAQCLEHDICVQASDMETLQRRFEATIEAECDGGDLDAIPPAPEELRQKWDEAEAMESGLDNTEMRLAA